MQPWIKNTTFSSQSIAALIVGVLLVGGVVSALMTADSRWMEWHLSRLGEGGQLSAYVFNFTVAMCALLLVFFTRSIVRDITKINIRSSEKRLAAKLLYGTLGPVSVGLLGVAAFPFDRFPIIHNAFGYGTTIAFVALIALLPKYLNVFGHRFNIATYSFIVILGVLFGIYFATNQRGIPLLYIELLALVYFFVWILVLVINIANHKKRHGVLD